jgi:RNA polymerase sigma factor (sigma-70 family)
MNAIPNTRYSLLLRLGDHDDQQAWQEFLEIYEPLLYRFARRRGLQHADALDVTQEVLAVVASAIERWNSDPSRGRFRAWLFRVSRNLVINAMAIKSHRPRGSGETTIQKLLEEQPAVSDEEATFYELEYCREKFRWAAERIRGEFEERTWEAFWQTSVDGRVVSDVAAQLGMTVGAVYGARSRVLARLRVTVERLEGR